MRAYNEGQQNYWAFGSSSGAFFYQALSLTPTTAPGLGNFIPFDDVRRSAATLLRPRGYVAAADFPVRDHIHKHAPWGFNPNNPVAVCRGMERRHQRQLGASQRSRSPVCG